MVLNSYFPKNISANHIVKLLVRWTKQYLSFHIYYVNVFAIDRKESKIPQTMISCCLSLIIIGHLTDLVHVYFGTLALYWLIFLPVSQLVTAIFIFYP